MTHPFQPKGILLDIDGTLTNSKREISEATATALARIGEKKIFCGVSTGRHYAAVKNYILPFFSENALHCTAGGGQIVTASGTVIWEKLLSKQVVQKITHEVERLGGAVVYGSGDTLYCSEALRANLEQHPWKISVQPISEPLDTPLISVVNIHTQIRTFIASLDTCSVKLMGSDPDSQYFDITAFGVNKAVAAAVWCEKLQIQLSEVLAAGDNTNDAELLARVGHSVAMAESPESLKKIAEIVVGSSDDDALATYLTQLLDLK